jgi:tRNA 2-thiouridine synthesizing protein E
MYMLEIDGTKIQTDEEGYVVDPDAWDESVAEHIAGRYGLSLTDKHWKVIEFMRKYYEEHHVAADARFVIKYISDELGMNGSGRSQLYKLFPYGYVQQACKIAGMRRPRAWSVG